MAQRDLARITLQIISSALDTIHRQGDGTHPLPDIDFLAMITLVFYKGEMLGCSANDMALRSRVAVMLGSKGSTASHQVW